MSFLSNKLPRGAPGPLLPSPPPSDLLSLPAHRPPAARAGGWPREDPSPDLAPPGTPSPGPPKSSRPPSPGRTRKEAARLCDVTAPPRDGDCSRAGLRADASRLGGVESWVPRSGVSAPQSGGAELEVGKCALPPGPTRGGGSAPVGQNTGAAVEADATTPLLSPAPR